MGGKVIKGCKDESRAAALEWRRGSSHMVGGPSWLRVTGRMGTHVSHLCVKDQDQTEGDLALRLPKCFPFTSWQAPVCTPRGASWQPTARSRFAAFRSNKRSTDSPLCPPLSVITTDLSKPRGTGQACTDNGENQIPPKGLM